MRKSLSLSSLFAVSLSFTCVYACSSPVTSPPSLKGGNRVKSSDYVGRSTSNKTELEKLLNEHQQKLRSIHTYQQEKNGAVALRIQQGQSESFFFNRVKQGFSTKSLSDTQTFAYTKNLVNLNSEQDFSIEDDSGTFYLSTEFEREDPQGKIEVWINGHSILSESGSVHLPQSGTFALRKQNSIKVEATGSDSFNFEIRIVRQGSVGTVIRPVNANETNSGNAVQKFFNPSSDDDLNGLLPHSPGNKNVRFPETQVADISLNDHIPEQVATGLIHLEIAEPEAQNLNTILDEFNAVIIQEPLDIPDAPRFYVIQPDLTKVNLELLEPQIRQLNAQQEDDYLKLQNIRFGNLESAKTFAFAVNMILDNRVDSVGLEPVLETSSSFRTVPRNVNCSAPAAGSLQPHTFEGKGRIIRQSHAKGATTLNTFRESQNFWWLTERSTSVTEAWRYSQGYSYALNRPVRVAVIDAGFVGLDELTQPGGDLENSVLMDRGGLIKLDIQNPQRISSATITPLSSAFLSEKKAQFDALYNNSESVAGLIHGTQVVSTIASNANDGTGIAGIAPQSEVIPYWIDGGDLRGQERRTSSWTQVVAALKDAGDQGVSVINISMNSRDMDVYLKGYFNTLSKNSWVAPAQALVKDLARRGIVLVGSAGNFGWPSVYTLPGKLYFPQMITVGALTEEKPDKYSMSIETHSPSGEVSTSCVEHGWPYEEGQEFQSSVKRYSANAVVNRTNNNGQTVVTVNEDTRLKLRIGSNYGDRSMIDIWAPGDEMFTSGPQINDGNTSSNYWVWSATSAAAPVVSGSVALIKALNPNLPVDQIRNHLNASADVHDVLDENLRTLPFLDESLNSERVVSDCGFAQKLRANGQVGKVLYNCGAPLPDSPVRMRMSSLNMKRAMENLPGTASEDFKARTLHGKIINGEFQALGHQFSVMGALPVNGMYGEQWVSGKDVFGESSSAAERTFTSYWQLLPGPLHAPRPSNPDFKTSLLSDSIISADADKKWQEHRFAKIEDMIQDADSSDYFKAEVFLGHGQPRLLSLEKLPNEIVTSTVNELENATSQHDFCTIEDADRYYGCENPADLYDPGSAILTWSFDTAENGQRCVKILSCLEDQLPSPEPTFNPQEPAPTNPPVPTVGHFSAPVVVSKPGTASNIKALSGSRQPKSILKNGPFASYDGDIRGLNANAGPSPASDWVEVIDGNQEIVINYPRVPNTVSLNSSSEKHNLRILLQIKNKGKGGQVFVQASGDVRTEKFGPGSRYPDGELNPISFEFIESARETGGTQVRIRVEGAEPGMKIIYKLFGVPGK